LQANRINNMFRSRAESEFQASSAHVTRNRVLASGLAHLLARRQELPAMSADLARAAEEQSMDSRTLERVARYVNAPAVKPDSQVQIVDKDGNTKVETTVRPSLSLHMAAR
jgi:hypothetical protein